ncbi:hypothetical protein [Methylibium sp.]|uniref:hypothetical protein n=1 Tax=Methylibium sp. TaxID=2067992 RepID=UPI001850986D|nr:hypothetical protein [Methylibium sp.]MBA3589284.1 hypothetical protein [Methylibium sp.]
MARRGPSWVWGPIQHVVVEVGLLAEFETFLHFVLAAQDLGAVRMVLQHATKAMQTEAVALRLLQAVEGRHEHIRQVVLEVTQAVIGVGRWSQILEMSGQLALDLPCIVGVVGGHQHLGFARRLLHGPTRRGRLACHPSSHAGN